jgi:preprotein translocase subunit SecG
MTVSLLGSLAGTLLGWLMGFLSLFLILLVLIQRGKGGGLTGALGGPGGQSAFGSKAGDTFTVITIVVASIWGFTCAFTMWLLGTHTPTAVTETNISAGPGDESETTTGSDLIIPPAGGDGIGGLGLDDEAPETTTTETPLMDLIPASDASKSTEAESTETGPESTETGPESTQPESTESESSDPKPNSSEPSESGPASTDSPAPAESDSDGGSDNN